MKKHLAVAVALSVTLGVSSIAPSFIAPTKVEAASVFTQEQQEAVDYLNSIRKAVGIKPVKLNTYLNKSAQNHVDYLTTNGIGEGHSETAGKKGFTGKTSDDRIRATGVNMDNYTYTGEVYAPGQASIKKAIDAFMDTAYHREALLSSSAVEVGVAIKGGSVIIDYLGDDYSENVDTAYPYDGQKGVGIGFYGMEDPNPLKKFGVSKSGYIISYTPAPEFFIDTLNFKLKDSKGADVPVHKDENWMGTSFFFPKQELKYGEKYTASVNYVDSYTGKKGSKTWSFTTMTKGGSPTTPTKPNPTTPAKPTVKYADFRAGQYWSDNMLWAIEKGLISGYTNVKNTKTGKYENLLKPNDQLTEAQFLAVLFRYTNPTELAQTKPTDPKFWASTPYQLAAKYKLPTNATLANKAASGKGITRGKMAQILASKHYGKVVDEKTAVKFMYDAGLSSGYSDKSGKSPKTYESYGADKILSRAHIVTFMKNYDTYLKR